MSSLQSLLLLILVSSSFTLPVNQPLTTQTSSAPSTLYTPTFLVNKSRSELPVYPFPNGICNNQNPNNHAPIPEIESRRLGVRQIALKFSNGNYDSAATYQTVLAQKNPSRNIMNFMYYQTALDGYNLTDVYYANKVMALILSKNEPLINAAMEFENWLFLDAYLRAQCLVTPEITASVLKYYQTVDFTAGRWTTSNLALLAATTRYLIGQTFPNSTFVSYNSDKTGYQLVKDRARALYYGQVAEYASQDYGVYDLFCFVTIAHFSNDSALASIADVGVQVGMARYAAVWWSDRLATQCMRCESNGYHNNNIWWFLADLWVYFGDSEINILGQSASSYLLTYSASVNYHIDPTILAVSKLTGPRAVQVYGPGEYTFFLQSFITDSYAIYISNTPVVSHEAIPGQSTLPGIFWNGHSSTYNASRSNFYMGVPSNDYFSGDYKWNGYPQEWMLEKSTYLLVVDNVLNSIDKTLIPQPFVIGNMPSSKEFPDSVLISDCANKLCNPSSPSPVYYLFYAFGSNSVLISIASSQVLDMSTFKYQNDRSFHAYLSRNDSAGFAVEAANPNDFVGSTLLDKLTAFKSKILSTTSFQFQDPQSSVVRAQLTYKDSNGNILWKQFAYMANAGDDWMTKSPIETVNGQKRPPFLNWPITSSPLVYQSGYPGYNAGQYSYGRYQPCPVFIRPSVTSAWASIDNPALKSQYSGFPKGISCIPPPS
ncbi:hypothetical protein HDU79_005138 [Rhizoclosmatium sp. JEL0117]|nr:hypothetical protein HDU79_005138 [Rhizoclosmatium sp. JEL0117]